MLTKNNITDICLQLQADKQNKSWNIRPKYREAFQDGIAAAVAVLKSCEGMSPDWVLEKLRAELNNDPYLSANKSDAYQQAVRIAMSRVHALKRP